jgi:hypothetical protein
MIMLQDFERLLSQVEVKGNTWTRYTQSDLIAFEMRTGLHLPEEYKDFCQIFGSGSFYFCDIDIPSKEGNEFVEHAGY